MNSQSHRQYITQIIGFIIVGIISTALDFFLYLFLLHFLSFNYLIASTTSYTISLIINYLLSMRFVFSSRKGRSKKEEFAIFVAITIIGLLLNQVFLFISVSSLGFSEEVAKIFATMLVMIYSFVSRKIFIDSKQ